MVPNPFGFLVTIVQYVYFPLLWQLTFVETIKLAISGGLLNHLIMEHNMYIIYLDNMMNDAPGLPVICF